MDDEERRPIRVLDLHQLCRDGNVAALQRELRAGHDLEDRLKARQGKLALNPLHLAADLGQVDVLRLLLDYDNWGTINSRTADGSTPLHLAVQHAHLSCVRLLLWYGARSDVADRDQLTARGRALRELPKASKSAVCRLLVSRELSQLALKQPSQVVSLLQQIPSSDLTVADVELALFNACRRGHIEAVSRLLLKKRISVERLNHAVTLAAQREHLVVVAMLMICRASVDGRVDMVRFLYGERDAALMQDPPEWYVREAHVPEIINAVQTHVPISLALERKRDKVAHELLLRSDIDRHSGIVNWYGIGLPRLEPLWLSSIASWCTRLYLYSNKLVSLPYALFDINALQMLDLSGNHLEALPVALLRMPNLAKLWVNHNHLKNLPEFNQWSPSLRILDLSHNHLTSLPDGIRSSRVEQLKLGNNDFVTLPSVIGRLRCLTSLDLRGLSRVKALPKSFGLLQKLQFLDVSGTSFNNIPPAARNDPHAIVAHMRQKLRDCSPAYRMKLVVLGDSQTGKSSVVASLRGDKTSMGKRYENEAELRICSVKVPGSGWRKPKYMFSVWDFSGFEEFRSMHHCLLSAHAMHLLVWRVTDGVEGIHRLRFWLDNIVTYSPNSPVLVVATFTDKLTAEQVNSGYVVSMRESLARLITRQPGYQCLQFHGMVETSLNAEHVPALRQAIYRAATSVQVNGKQLMGMPVPYSYSALAEHMERVRNDRKVIFQCPILDKEDMWKLVTKQIDNHDINTEEDLMEAIRYLHLTGVILHYEVPNGGLDHLVFVDPHWLYAMLARLVMARNRDAFQKTGFLMLSDLEPIYACHRFPMQFHRAFLHLLNRFGVATIWDDTFFFVKNMLEDMPMRDLERYLPANHKVACFVRLYYMNVVPISFESRLLTRILLLLRSWLIMCDVANTDANLSITGLGRSRTDAGSSDNGWEYQAPENTATADTAATPTAAAAAATPPTANLFCWRRGIAYITSNGVWFTLEMVRKSNSSRCLQLRSSSNSFGCHLMALMATAVHCLFRDWFPHLLSGNDSVMATVQMINCVKCQHRREEHFDQREQRREARAARERRTSSVAADSSDSGSVSTISTGDSREPEFSFGQCIEALMESDSIKCRRCLQSIPLIDLIPEVMLVHVKSHPIVEYATLLVRDLKRCSDSITDVSEGNGIYNGEPVVVRVFATATPQTFAVETFDDEIDRALEDEAEILPQEQTEEQVVLERAYHQLRLESVGLCSVKHPNMLQCLALCLRPPALVLPISNFQRLNVVLFNDRQEQRPPITRLYLMHCAAQLSSALRYIHSLHIAHLGVSSSAVLVASTDFNVKHTVQLGNVANGSRVWPSGSRGMRGVPGYQPPEMLHHNGEQEYDGIAADSYALAMVLFEMVAREPAVTINEQDLNEEVLNGWRPPIMSAAPAKCGLPAMTALAVRCWRSDPPSRPIASRCEAMLRAIDANLLLGGDLMHPNTVPRLAVYAQQKDQVWICDDSGEHGCLVTAFDARRLSKLALHEVAQARVMAMCTVMPPRREVPSSLPAMGSNVGGGGIGLPVMNEQIWLALLNGSVQVIDCTKYHCIREVMTPDVCIALHSSPNTVFMALANGRVLAVPSSEPILSGKLNIVAETTLRLGSLRSMVLVAGKELWCAHQNRVVFLALPSLEHIDTWECSTAGMICDLVYDEAHGRVWSFLWRTLDLLCWRADNRDLVFKVNLATIEFAPECMRTGKSRGPAGTAVDETDGGDGADDDDGDDDQTRSLPTCVPQDLLSPNSDDDNKTEPLHNQKVSFQASVTGDKHIQRVLPVQDTLWIGLVDGCVLILKADSLQLLAVLTPHLEGVRCLLKVPAKYGACGGTSSGGVVITGGRGRQPAVQYLLSAEEECRLQAMVEEDRKWPGSQTTSLPSSHLGSIHDASTGALLLWEAVSSETLITLQQRQLEATSTIY
eukprot:scpid22775/ scgid23487/ Leucine-rich repeat serine/threonine-protein kinase 1